ncbi:hypothetical protein CAPTEDRAFT_190666 [Capitella teleta]|uniref:Uncharacterized protein n=1 Tax=Capitella teleta TaxID=283909 RepID=R7T5X6_CAPTE|nr:hypothetical protein CAPTEDRAFT_190666 [Capitella teleta]|eukprot:ELT88854.1 hypothetical protein CAPTEDRAFT_190666 [Capitella teleta]
MWFHEACIKEDVSASISNWFTRRKLPSLIRALIDGVKSLHADFAAHKATGSSAIETLSEECGLLRKQNDDLQMNTNVITEVIKSKDTRNSVTAAPTSQPSLYSDVVRSSVRSALQDEKARNEVIVSRIKETENGTEAFRNICSEVEFDGSPSEVVRLGKKLDGRDRHMKGTFATPFDARRFYASVNAHKEN